MSQFKEWFKKQFGGLPNERRRRAMSAKIHQHESDAAFLRQELRKQEWLRDAWDSALKGWNARPSR